MLAYAPALPLHCAGAASLHPSKPIRSDRAVLDEDIPAGGAFYCTPCSRYFVSKHALSEHARTKPHKRRWTSALNRSNDLHVCWRPCRHSLLLFLTPETFTNLSTGELAPCRQYEFRIETHR
jgi:hypothetical protein